ncbi:MAG: DUF2160 domain-containing protein [Cypionkella sp.]
MTKSNWSAVYATTAAIMAISLGLLLWATPRKDGAFAWFDPMIAGGWMAWTFPVALFFYLIACLLVIFTILAIRFPETPRIGVLHIETTRGDRLFISLLGSAFITLGWLALIGASLWGALILCLIYAAAVFRWV